MGGGHYWGPEPGVRGTLCGLVFCFVMKDFYITKYVLDGGALGFVWGVPWVHLAGEQRDEDGEVEASPEALCQELEAESFASPTEETQGSNTS